MRLSCKFCEPPLTFLKKYEIIGVVFPPRGRDLCGGAVCRKRGVFMCFRLVSWNVNGIRALMAKGFPGLFDAFRADVVCLQETKATTEQAGFDPPGYFHFWNAAEKKGYAGTAAFSRQAPLRVLYGIGMPEHDAEGRVITLEFADFFVVNVYAPNSKQNLERLAYRQIWEAAFRSYVCALRDGAKKGVVICGDLNVAHT
jgi:exodeoxyribonuclease-3